MLLPTIEETQICINFADGQQSLTLDAMDIDNIIKDVWSNKIPEDSSFEAEFCAIFKQRYQRTISKSAANMLCGKKAQILTDLKKKLSLLEEPSDSSEQVPASPEEN